MDNKITRCISNNKAEQAAALLPEWISAHSNDTAAKIEMLTMFVTRFAAWRERQLKIPLREIFKLADSIISDGAEDAVYFQLALLNDFCYDIEKAHEYLLKHMEKHKSNPSEYMAALQYLSINANFNGLLSGEDYIKYNREIFDFFKKDLPVRRFENGTEYFRPVKVGLVSYDLFAHPIGMFISSLFPLLNEPRQVEIHCYYTNGKEFADEITEHIMNGADSFNFVKDLTDGELGKLLLSDGLDVIIDLSNRSHGNKLTLLSQRFAPIQMTWMGFPFTTAMPNIDYNIGDENIDAPSFNPAEDSGKFLTEEIIHMKPCYMCYGLNVTALDRNAAPPCVKNGYITFGNMSQPNRLSRQTLKLWKSVMDSVPNSVLRLKFPKSEAFAVEKFKQRLSRNGLDLSRIIIDPHKGFNDYLNTYNEADIILDTFPYNGCTTLFDSFMMGTPTVSLMGRYRQSRHCMFLNYVELGDLIAESTEEYVYKAVRLSRDTARLTQIKKNLPGIFKNSVLYDKRVFQTAFENMVRQAYLKYCFENKKDDCVNPSLDGCLRAERILQNLARENEPEENLRLLVNEYVETVKKALPELLGRASYDQKTSDEIAKITLSSLKLLENAPDVKSAVGYVPYVNETLKMLR